MTFRTILLVLPALAIANIDLHILGEYNGVNVTNLTIHFSGDDVGIITDVERNTFNLSDDSLKNAVHSWSGKRPHDVYVHSPTPLGDLYKKYGWQEVTRTLTPRSSKILDISTKSTVILQRVFENHKEYQKSFDFGISQEVLKTISSSWSTSGELSISKNISYDIKLIGIYNETAFSYTSPWGKNTKQSQIVTLGDTSKITITLNPGQSIIAQVLVTRYIIQIQIEYEATLSGLTIVKNSGVDNENHFRALDISACMNSGGISNQIMSHEIIEIVLIVDSKMAIFDMHHK